MRAFALSLSLLLLIFGCKKSGDGAVANPRAAAPQGIVKRGELVQRVTVSGTVHPRRKSLITAPYAGYVRKLYVKIGDRVKEGDPIVSVTQSLRAQEEVYPLRSPFSGTVVQVLKAEGEYIASGGSDVSTIVRIDDLSQLRIEANAPEIEFPKLKIGQEVIVRATAILDRTYQGRIQSIALASKEQSSWERSRVEFPFSMEVLDEDARLKPGMTVIVDIVAQKLPSVLMLRHEFIEKSGDQYYVTLEGGDRRPIQVGTQNEEVFEVKSGLKEGDQVRPVQF